MGAHKAPSSPPKRPKDFDEVGFEPQSFVRWFRVGELVRAGTQALLSDLFGSFADKREVQAALQGSTREAQLRYENEAKGADFWFDFVADVGDGFNATYSIALLLAKDSLVLELPSGERVTAPRGRLLLMGGDEVYPTANRKAYVDRTLGPYRAALPYVADEAAAPHVYALPGNHDWYDGLSAFLRVFAQRNGRWIGAWRTQQRRSYFAQKLPRGVWLWGIDIQLHADIDSPQLEYFDEAAALLAPGDRVILATAEPSWVKEAEGSHAGYQSLLLIMAKVPAANRIVMVLTGDSHHYARYVDAEGVHFVTAGGGGAFLHGTHTLPSRILLPTSSDSADQDRARTLERRATFPSAGESRRLIRARIALFPWINRSFWWVWFVPWLCLSFLLWSEGLRGPTTERIIEGLAATLGSERILEVRSFLLAMAALLVVGVALRTKFPSHAIEQAAPPVEHLERSAPNTEFEWRKWVDISSWAAFGALLFRLATVGTPSAFDVVWNLLLHSPTAVLLIALVPLASALYMSRPIERTLGLVPRLALGLAHGCSYLLAWILVGALVAKLVQGAPDGILPLLWILGTAAGAATASTLLFGGGLWFGGQYQRALLNDAFSAIGVEDYKNFLRIRIDRDGDITVYAVGLHEVAKDWEINRDTSDSAPFIRPKGGVELDHHVIESFTIAARAKPAKVSVPGKQAQRVAEDAE